MSDIDDFDEAGEGGDVAPPEAIVESGETNDALMAAPGACLSCGAALAGLFCVNCGQKQDDLRRSLFLLGRQFIEDTFAFDSRMWRTLGLLAVSPGVVPTQYSHGRRSRFTPPVRLFLVVSFLFFLTIGLTNTLFVGLEVTFKDSETAAPTNVPVSADGVIVVQNTDSENGSNCSFQGSLRFFVKERDLTTDRERLEACLSDTRDEIRSELESEDVQVQIGEDDGREAEVDEAQEIVDRVFGGINWAVSNPREFNDAFNDWLPRVMFFMTPVLALILTLFLRKNALIFDHMVLSLYMHAVSFAIVGTSLVLAQVGVSVAGLLSVIAIGVYYIAALKRAYGRGWIKTVWTASLSGLIYIVIFASILVGIMSKVVWQAVG